MGHPLPLTPSPPTNNKQGPCEKATVDIGQFSIGKIFFLSPLLSKTNFDWLFVTQVKLLEVDLLLEADWQQCMPI